MPKSLDIEAGSRTDRGLKTYRTFYRSVYLRQIHRERAQSYGKYPRGKRRMLSQPTGRYRRDEWEWAKAAWHNIRQYGAPTWYEWVSAIGEQNGTPTDMAKAEKEVLRGEQPELSNGMECAASHLAKTVRAYRM